jgi:16S rRNA processing protein RimM
MKEPRLIPVGKIVRTHGVRGGVKIHAYGESLSAQQAGSKLYLNPEGHGRRSWLTLVRIKPQGKHLLAEIEELTSIDLAQEVIGEELYLPLDCLPPTTDDEYYHYQLIGLGVETTEGKEVGVLSGIIETPANDVFVVKREGKEVLIPAVADVVCRVDLERGRMVIDPPEGLMDDL